MFDVCAAALLLPSTTMFASLRTPIALALALIAGIPSVFIIWREFMAVKGVEHTN
jgi:hypothetical protein